MEAKFLDGPIQHDCDKGKF